jgi:uncharacterized RDD family membrane protein YckC
MSQSNPYAPPIEASAPLIPAEQNLASQNQRFLNMIIDSFAIFGLNLGAGIVVGTGLMVVGGESVASESFETTLNIISYAISFTVLILYYTVLEVVLGRTLGKLVTGTRVVRTDGSKPSIGQVIGRTLCRFIPFEAFSFFGNKGFPIGWHDRIPSTKVVKCR